MHRYLLFAAFGWLTFTGIMHFGIDVLAHAIQGRHPPGRETTLYYGLQSAFALGKAAFGVLGLIVIWRAPLLAGSGPFLALSILVGTGWLAIAWLFIDYRQPMIAVAVFGALLLCALFVRP